MSSRVEFAVSVTPVVTMTSTDAADKDAIGSDVGKGLGGSANVAVGQEAHTTVGYSSGTVAYLEAVDDAKTQLGADNTAYDMVFIKHTGHIYSDATTLGATASADLDVYVEYSAGASWAKICSIPAGGAIILPKFPAQGASLGIFVQPASGTDHIAVEYVLIT